ncbi:MULTISPECIES: envelope stress response membrane protein PspB [unclassified Vibrio]|uniref:envelope stress response membrane protein PspB n=1 Tax=unclassified Vibrio TaxID=2614977 RepID=UPI000B8ED50C|nr:MULTISPECIES: envelope stress response membrane protein PspB [unclassified Vibrio]NAW89745.1 envelope stress response membrane protein PspB [Vibrio sp. V24_P1S3T111]OXX21856.1 envelope stress response membrane protein PspB [Vibrio sp. V05_P4A8T149]OXX25504.1 envelope stress response membrane protein PspB [Vibrio sp. V06_P1A73T115]OXX34036.1 envelope stress response membrane protein PspB [Vibrio sp. V14_P6S14T42]OXX35794.1 envelope stress response membrane protein PspB [Vibrio sp. V04_P4A5T1
MSSFFIAGPLIVFLIFVAPIWLFLHYRGKRYSSNSLSQEDLERIKALSEKAEKLQSRVETLERILDAESPTWRQNHG